MKEHKYTHLGKAPYILVSYLYDPPIQDINGAWHGGQHSCDHCGRGISHVYICKSSDGKLFDLGSVHVEDLGDEDLTLAVRSKAKQVKAEAAREARREKWAEIAEINRKNALEAENEHQKKLRELQVKAIEELERIKPELQKRSHPNFYFASKGKTMLDYIQFWFDKGLVITSPRIMNIMRQSGANI